MQIYPTNLTAQEVDRRNFTHSVTVTVSKTPKQKETASKVTFVFKKDDTGTLLKQKTSFLNYKTRVQVSVFGHFLVVIDEHVHKR